MGLGKTYSTSYLADSNNNTGEDGQVLISTATGINWVDGGGVTGGPFLPLSAGAGFPLTDALSFSITPDTSFPSASIKHNSNGYVYFSGGANGALFGNSNQQVRLQANATNMEFLIGGTTKAIIASTGNVGIGTTSPSNKLHVNIPGNDVAFRVSRNNGTDGDLEISFSNAITAYNSKVNGHRWLENGSEKMRLNAGKLGIGTTTPGAKLDVRTSSDHIADFITTTADSLAYIRVQNNVQSSTDTNTAAAAIELVGKADASGHGRHVWIGAEGVNNTDYRTKLKFKIRNGANDFDWSGTYEGPTIMTLDGNGNVGIGTTSPSSKLHVVGDTYVTGQFAQGVAVASKIASYGAEFRSSGASAQIFFGRSNSSVGSGAIGADDSYVFRVWKTSDFSQPFVIRQSGNVGIGSTNPSEKLHIKESASNSYAAFRLEGSNRGGIIDMYQAAYPVSRYLTDQSGNIGIYTSGAFGSTTLTEKFAIATNGQIKLNEYGSNSFTGTAAYALAVDSSGNVIETAVGAANNWTVSGNSIYSNNAGTVSIGSQNATTDRRFQVTGSNTALTAAQQFGIVNNPTYPTVVTSSVYNFYGAPSLTIGTTLTNLYNIYLSPNGIAGSTVTSSFGLYQAGGNDKNYFAGNVGIGTTNPGAHLHVSASSDAHLLIESDNTMSFYQDASWSSTMMFGAKWNGTNQVYGATTRGAFKMVALHDGDTSPQYLAIYGANHGTAGGTVTWNTVGFAQDEDGNVGIGTTSPSTKLDVNGDIALKGTSVFNLNAPALTIGDIAGTDSVTTLKLTTADDSTTVYLDDDGNVGIGTTDPKAALDVKGRFLVDSKTMTITNSFNDALTVVMSNHTGCYVKITAFGDWSSHSSISYLGEFFLNNGAGGYSEPGLIIRQIDGTASDAIEAQIVDPGGTTGDREFIIQLRATATASFTAYLTYNIQGMFVSAS